MAKREAKGRVVSFDYVISRFAKIKKETGQQIEGVDEEEAMRLLSAARGSDIFISMLGGNQFNAFGMLQHPHPFDVYDKDLPSAVADGVVTLIPSKVLDDAFDGYVGGRHFARLKALTQVFVGQSFIATPPPPKADDDFVRFNAETYFRQLGVESVGVSPALLRLKLWRVQVRALERLCRSNGLGIIYPPPGALDETGFLRVEAYGSDATHANALYGNLFIELVEEKVKALSLAAAT